MRPEGCSPSPILGGLLSTHHALISARCRAQREPGGCIPGLRRGPRLGLPTSRALGRRPDPGLAPRTHRCHPLRGPRLGSRWGPGHPARLHSPEQGSSVVPRGLHGALLRPAQARGAHRLLKSGPPGPAPARPDPAHFPAHFPRLASLCQSDSALPRPAGVTPPTSVWPHPRHICPRPLRGPASVVLGPAGLGAPSAGRRARWGMRAAVALSPVRAGAGGRYGRGGGRHSGAIGVERACGLHWNPGAGARKGDWRPEPGTRVHPISSHVPRCPPRL